VGFEGVREFGGETGASELLLSEEASGRTHSATSGRIGRERLERVSEGGRIAGRNYDAAVMLHD
jgi:hypothetical protein